MTENQNNEPQEQQTQNQVQEIKPRVEIDTKQERMWAMFCHLSALIAFIGIPFGNIIGPLVLWLIKKNEIPLVDEEGKEALNFQISMSIYAIVSMLLIFVFIGFFLLWGLAIADVILIVIAAIKTNNGEKFSYPCSIRFIK